MIGLQNEVIVSTHLNLSGLHLVCEFLFISSVLSSECIFRKKLERNDSELRAALESYAGFVASISEKSKSESLYAEVSGLPE